MSDPLVSICTPTYNRPAYLAELVDSVRSQRYANWEMWICDNSEADETARAMDRVRDVRIHYERNDRNLGMGGNALKVLSKVTGDLFTFTPDDDRWGPDNLARKVEFLADNADVDVVFSNATRMDVDGRTLRPFRSVRFQGGRRILGSVLRPSRGQERPYFVNILTALMRRPLLPIFRESWHLNTEEYFMWWLGCARAEIGFIGEELLALREADHHRVVVHEGALVDFKRRADYRQRQILDFYRCLLAFHPEIAGVLESRAVKSYVVDGIVGAATRPVDLLRAILVAAGGIDMRSGGRAAMKAPGSLARLLAQAYRRDADPSGLGPVDRNGKS